MERWGQRTYIPSWQELFITIALATTGFIAFHFIAKNFPVFTSQREHATIHAREHEVMEELRLASK
jgi:hypothetical protein